MFGAAARGSRRWIELPFFRFQPSELGKVLLVVALAAFVIERDPPRHIRSARRSRIMLLGLAPTTLVFLQPDLGTGIIYVDIALALLFVAGAVDSLRGARRSRGVAASSCWSSPRTGLRRCRATRRTASPLSCTRTTRAKRAIS